MLITECLLIVAVSLCWLAEQLGLTRKHLLYYCELLQHIHM
jgi:hypothetical protein